MRKISGVSILLVVFLLIGMLTLGGCDTAAPPDDDDDDNGTPAPDPEPEFKQLVVALESVIPTFDLHDHRNRAAQSVARNWTDSFMQAMPDGSHISDVAVSIDQVDPVTYEIEIRRDVLFHNGDPLTADDVVFTLERVSGVLDLDGGTGGGTSPRRALIGPIESVEKIDDYNVRVTLATPQGVAQIRRWYNAEIIPKDYFYEVGREAFFQSPIGIGPFKWVEGDTATEIVLERFEDYYGGAELPGDVDRVPAVDRVILKFIAEDTTRVAALMAGEVDICQAIPFDSIEMLEKDPNINIMTAEGTNMVAMQINTSKWPFSDKRVRQALAYAINYDLLVNELLLGYSSPLKGLPHLEPYAGEPGSGQFGDLKSTYDYDPEKAKALLEEAGATEFSLIIDTWAEFPAQAQAIAQMWGDIGIDASVRVWDLAVVGDEFKKGERDIYLSRFGNAGRGPGWVNSQARSGVVSNRSQYANPVFDELIAKVLSFDECTPERTAAYIEAVEIIMEDLPVLAIHAPMVVEAARSHVKNFYPSSVGRVNLHRVDIE